MPDDTTEGLRERMAEKLWNDEQLIPWSRAFQNPEFRYDMEVLFERVDELLAEVSPVLERQEAEIKRLRGALEEVALRTVQRDLSRIAKGALEGREECR